MLRTFAPSLESLDPGLTKLPKARLVFSLILPFAFSAATIVLLVQGRWILSAMASACLTFSTYGSVSHDLVHRCYRLPATLNLVLLSAMELTTLRSGVAYRASHLAHHRHFPNPDVTVDPEAKVAGGGLVAGVIDGPFQQLRILRWAWKHAKPSAKKLLGFETLAIGFTWVGSVLLALAGEPFMLVYCALVTIGAWTVPVITVTIPHDPTAEIPETQTRAFRGKIFDAVSFGHLYHLEHHLYPQVPHQNWRRLASALDGHLEENGVVPLRGGDLIRRRT